MILTVGYFRLRRYPSRQSGSLPWTIFHGCSVIAPIPLSPMQAEDRGLKQRLGRGTGCVDGDLAPEPGLNGAMSRVIEVESGVHTWSGH